MTTIIAVRHGKPSGPEVTTEEQNRVGEAVRDFAARAGISLAGAHILAGSTPRAMQTGLGIAKVNDIPDIATSMDVPADSKIFSSYPSRDQIPWISSQPVNALIDLIRAKAAEIAPKQLIVVGNVPSLWALGARLDPDKFPPFVYTQESAGTAEDMMRYGEPFLLDLDADTNG